MLCSLRSECGRERTGEGAGGKHTTSRVVTPIILAGSNTPAFLYTSAAIGTVELTGLEMMARTACAKQTIPFMSVSMHA
jgi:hypothetical protein